LLDVVGRWGDVSFSHVFCVILFISVWHIYWTLWYSPVLSFHHIWTDNSVSNRTYA
jgi:hypothetical protein